MTSNARDVALQADPRGGSGLVADEIYAVVSVLYRALQGAAAYDKYVGDAQKVGDQELESFFQACRAEEQARARRARTLLVARLACDDDELGPLSASSGDSQPITDGS